MAKAKPASKLCIRCRKVKPLGDFYKNSGWKEQNYCDIFCKECARELVKNKETVRQYFWENNRMWDERVWSMAESRAQYRLSTNAEYIKPSTSQKRRDEIADKETAVQCLNVMGLARIYKYSPNMTEDGEMRPFDPDSKDGTLFLNEDGTEDAMSTRTVYSKEWNGFYTTQDLDFLNDYYEQLEADFPIDDVVMRDSSKKVCKAALADDKAYNNMLAGTGTMNEWKIAHEVYEKILASTNFAASQRKTETDNGMKALGTIIAAVEIKEDITALCRQQLFPEDDIDAILRDFRHTEVAIQ